MTVKILPNFFCVGAQKSGTTTLHNILKQHPNIYLPILKETKFFQDNDLYRKGIKFYQKEFFSKWKGEKAVGEIDPDYMYFEYVAERIYQNLGKNLKFIFMLRNPIDRAYSHYLMVVRRGYENESFENAIKLEKQRIKKGIFYQKNFSYISRGLYSKQIKKYLDLFEKKNMMFIIFEEDFIKNRKQTIKKILEFLEVEIIDLNVNIKSNPASMPRSKIIRDLIYKPHPLKEIGKLVVPKKMRLVIKRKLDELNQKPIKPSKISTKMRRYLLDNYFYDEIKELEKIIDRDLSVWLKA